MPDSEKMTRIIKLFLDKGLEKTLEKYFEDLPHAEFLEAMIKPGKNGRRTSDHVRSVVEKLQYLLKNQIDEVIVMDTSKGIASDEDRISKNYKGYKLLTKIVGDLSEPEKKLLLCAALYHDIGKSIIYPRHGPEGADVIKDSGSPERKLFRDLGFDRYDFYFMSDLIRFHDYLGMLCTGETSYLIFAEALNPVSNISLSNDTYSEKFFEFLLLLNLADIAGSIGRVDSEDFTIMVHDFERIKEIYKKIEDHREFQYRENINVVSELVILSENHTHERLRRLLRNGFKNLDKMALSQSQVILAFPETWLSSPISQNPHA